MKTIQTKIGKGLELKYPTLEDTKAMLEYINALIAEDAFVLLTEPMTYEQEEAYVKDLCEKIAEQKDITLLAWDGEVLVGICGIEKLQGRELHMGKFGISVRASHRGRGIAKALATKTIDEAKKKIGIMKVFLTVASENTIARTLYEKLGFVEFGVLPGALRDKDTFIDSVYMYKDL